MKVANIIVKILVALAAVAGAVYVAATYGDQIVAWCKKMINCKCCCEAEGEVVEEAVEEPVEEIVEAVPAEEAPAEEAPAVAESDFEG